MNAAYVLAGVAAVGLLLYLIAALFKPEWFD